MVDEGGKLYHQIHTAKEDDGIGKHIFFGPSDRYIIQSRFSKPIFHCPLRTRRRLGVLASIHSKNQRLTSSVAAQG